MKLPRFLSTRLASALALGCALLALAAVPGAAQAQVKITTLTDANLDKMLKFIETVKANADDKAAMKELFNDGDALAGLATGGSVDELVNTKHPEAAAVIKKGGYTADNFFTVIMSLGVASTSTTTGVSDPDVAKANVDFYNANKDKIDKAMASMK